MPISAVLSAGAGDKGHLIKRLTAEIQNSRMVSKEDILFDISRCIANAIKARDFSLYLVCDQELQKYEQGNNKG